MALMYTLRQAMAQYRRMVWHTSAILMKVRCSFRCRFWAGSGRFRCGWWCGFQHGSRKLREVPVRVPGWFWEVPGVGFRAGSGIPQMLDFVLLQLQLCIWGVLLHLLRAACTHTHIALLQSQVAPLARVAVVSAFSNHFAVGDTTWDYFLLCSVISGQIDCWYIDSVSFCRDWKLLVIKEQARFALGYLSLCSAIRHWNRLLSKSHLGAQLQPIATDTKVKIQSCPSSLWVVLPCTHTCIHTYMHAYIHTYLRTYIHT